MLLSTHPLQTLKYIPHPVYTGKKFKGNKGAPIYNQTFQVLEDKSKKSKFNNAIQIFNKIIKKPSQTKGR